MNRWKKLLGIFMSGAVLITSGILPQNNATTVKAEEKTDYGISNPRVENGVTTWDKIKFGSYYQDIKPEPIKWRVLSVDGDDVFLIADEILEYKQYSESKEHVTWETSTLRQWLNDDFYNEAFDSNEKKAVMDTLVVNNDNPSYETVGGNDTVDKVYLLSIAEASNADYGFDTEFRRSSKTRAAKNTGYAKEKKAWYAWYGAEDDRDWNGSWWLRSSGYDNNFAAYVEDHGYGNAYGMDVGNYLYAVRPALHINLSSYKVTDAGEVDTKGNVTMSTDGIHAPRVKDDVTTWDCVYFGSYKQNFVKKDIEWRVLSVDGDDAFLLADKNLDCKKYNDDEEKVTWETCTLRKWLNEDFYNKAFNDEEKKAIKDTTIINTNSLYGTEGGNDTVDKLYLLSISEASKSSYGFWREYGNSLSSRRGAKNTVYVNEKTTYLDSNGNTLENGFWWLRSPGYAGNYASYVSPDGYGSDEIYGTYVNSVNYAVRPALHINLSSSSWSKVDVMKPDATPFPTKEPSEYDYEIGNPTVENGVTTWDKIKFGSYYQDLQSEPIKWRVLSVDGDDAFLLADKCLDCKPYNEKWEYGVTWETCTLRKWLNGNFYDEAFDDEEKKAIRKTTVINEDHDNQIEGGCDDTEDNIYLLSLSEVDCEIYGLNKGYKTPFGRWIDKTRIAKNSDYAKWCGAWTDTEEDTLGNGKWWLRSSGGYDTNASYVSSGGFDNNSGDNINSSGYGIRPVLHINLLSSKITDAGEVDSDDNITESDDGINNPRVKDGVTTWDCVYFGSYKQNFTKQDIEWRVLSVDGDDAFLLADKNLDCIQYNEEYEDVTWETSMLGKWLNTDFYNEAFNDEEKKAIINTRVVNDDNSQYDTTGGNDTGDNVYLLSLLEASDIVYGFDMESRNSSVTREAKNTDYAKMKGAYSNTNEGTIDNGRWWLRSPGNSSNYASYVNYNGSETYYGTYVYNSKNAVRPVLHINLSSYLWSNAGKVTAVLNSDDKPIFSHEPTRMPLPLSTISPEPTAKPSVDKYDISGPRIVDGVMTWDKVNFGRYYQDVEISAEPIKWRVLSVDGDDALLLADRNLDCKQYNDEEEKVTWDTCSLRKWLNENFYNEAFDAEEKKAIKKTKVFYGDNTEQDGNLYTKDKVYLLSKEEASNSAYGFDSEFGKSSRSRESKNTDYAKVKNADNGSWWLRLTSNRFSSYAPIVYDDGYGYDRNVDNGVSAVRPVLHVNLSSSKVMDAGEVDSEGNTMASADGINPPRVEDGVTTWDCVYFGNYRQNSELKKKEIEWRVLSVDGDDAFLLADKNLDCKRYNDEDEPVTWETSDLRRWLNEDFYNEAFDSTEKKAVMETAVINEDNQEYGTEGGNDTTDNVFILSIAEASNAAYGFDKKFANSSKARESKNTDYIKVNNSPSNDADGNGYWWLRSPGKNDTTISCISSDGTGYSNHYSESNCYYRYNIRPAIHINLSSYAWSEAGQVNAEGEEIKPSEKLTGKQVYYGIDNPKIENGVTTWDKIKFGSYYQEPTVHTEPIKWRVLSVDDNKAFLIADKILDCKKYNEKSEKVTWEACTLRKWLNEDFYNEAFDTEEKKAVIQTTVINDDNPDYGSFGGLDTEDKVYLLSIDEASNINYGFASDFSGESGTRETQVTDYAKTKDGYADFSSGQGYWWLRSPGGNNYRASYVNFDGSGSSDGGINKSIDYESIGVRPVLSIDISSSKIKKAGKVDSEGNTFMSDGTINNPEVKDGVTTWDCVYFGNYGQNCTFEKQDIEWRVLSVDGYDAFLLADKILDVQAYDDNLQGWDGCGLRNYLNEDFYNEIFNEEEKRAIINTVVPADDGRDRGLEVDVYTKDKLYLLSSDEACNELYGFDTNYNKSTTTREAKNTGYVRLNMASIMNGSYEKIDENWWLRSRNFDKYYPDGISDQGRRYHTSEDDPLGVRPVLHINLSSTAWSEAGQVSSDEKKEEQPTPNPTEKPVPTGKPVDYGISNPRIKDGITTWDKVKFGSYYQDAEIQPAEPIKWRVLSVDGDDAFLLADKVLDCKPYDDVAGNNATWETCSLREWLNEDFYYEAFDTEERSLIKETDVDNTTAGGNDTKDNLYILSSEESFNTGYGFDSKESKNWEKRLTKGTDYARLNGVRTNALGQSIWMLRSKEKEEISSFHSTGYGDFVNVSGTNRYAGSTMGVRPVMHINLASSKVRYAGKIDSEDNILNISMTDTQISNPSVKDGVTTWDCVYFGNYRQNCKFEKQDIEWRVLSVDGDDAFLLADKNLDCKTYCNNGYNLGWATWITSPLRKWLNKDFYNEAFNSEEKSAVISMNIDNDDGRNTLDKVYLLSEAEAVSGSALGFDMGNGFSKTREASNTDYAKFCGAFTNLRTFVVGADCGYWWLRSGGKSNGYGFEGYAAVVEGGGSVVYNEGFGSYQDANNGVRPVVHINLSSPSWSKAGQVTAVRNSEKPTATPSPTVTPEPTNTPQETATPKPTEKVTPRPTEEPIITGTPSPTVIPEPTKAPQETATPKPTEKVTPKPTEEPLVTGSPLPTVIPEPTKAPQETTSPFSTKTPIPTPVPVPSSEPVREPSVTDNAAQLEDSPETPAPVRKIIKLSSVKCAKNTKKITGKLSIAKATVRIKVGKKAYKKASVKGKKFTLKLNYRLKKKTKITVKVTKKGYKEIRKVYRVK